jgi:hypothetical protein
MELQRFVLNTRLLQLSAQHQTPTCLLETLVKMPSTLGIVSSGHLDRPLWISAPPVFTYGFYDFKYLEVKSSLEVSIYLVSGALPSGIYDYQDGNTLHLVGQPDSKSSYSATFRAENSLGYSDFTISGTPIVNKISATGGTVTDYGGYRVHAFTASSNFTVTSGIDDIQYSILAGGGGGASDGNGAGGGGAGGYITGTILVNQTGAYSVVVGAGGATGSSGTSGFIGASSSVFGYSSLGGGRGGANSVAGGYGGCGGGGGCFAGYGNAANNYRGGSSSWYNGGGGGGIGAIGANGNTNPNETGGNGGAGAATPPSGWLSSQVTRGGGGAGGGGSQGGTATGGSGGGGNGYGYTTGGNATQGAEQYGAGGGGGYYNGAKGGSGYVWVRYAL